MACAPAGTSQWRKSRRRIRRRTLAVFKLNALSSHTRTHTHARAHMRIHAHSLVFFPNGVRELVEDPLSLSFSLALSHSQFSRKKRERRNFEVYERASCALRDIDLPTIAAVHDDDDDDDVDGFGRAKRWCGGAAA